MHDVTSLARNTSTEARGGADPRLARLRETQHTDDRRRTGTNSSETERRVGVTVTLGETRAILRE